MRKLEGISLIGKMVSLCEVEPFGREQGRGRGREGMEGREGKEEGRVRDGQERGEKERKEKEWRRR